MNSEIKQMPKTADYQEIHEGQTLYLVDIRGESSEVEPVTVVSLESWGIHYRDSSGSLEDMENNMTSPYLYADEVKAYQSILRRVDFERRNTLAIHQRRMERFVQIECEVHEALESITKRVNYSI